MQHGLGSQLHLLSLAATIAYVQNRTLVVPSEDSWWLTAEADCSVRGMQKYACTTKAKQSKSVRGS